LNKKVAILGKLPSKFKAPFDDKTYDIWTMNKHTDMKKIPRIDLIFDIHSINPNKDAHITRQNYPFREAEELLGGNYFNNTVSYMIAYAILLKYKEIALYGMRFLMDFERRKLEYQNVRELIFFAKGRGIKVTSPEDEIMLKEYNHYGI
jgi:hypothetical protein